MKKKHIITAAIASLLGLSASADLINFTSAEGYSAGQLRANALWNGSGSEMLVDPTGSGSVTNIGANAFKNMTYEKPFSASSTEYTASSVISFDHLGTQTQNQNVFVYATSFQHADGDMYLFLRRKDGADNFQMVFFDQNGANTTHNSDDVAGTDLGLSGDWTEVSSSDQIKMSMTITRGATTNDWTVSATMENLDTSTQLATISGSFESTQAFFDDDVSMGFNSRNLPSDADMSTITLHSFEAIPEPATLGLFVIGVGGVGLLRKYINR
jgi:hypothetical protein